MRVPFKFFLFIIMAITVSCSKEEETPSFQKEDFIGVWYVEAYEGPDEDVNSCPSNRDQWIFLNDELTSVYYSEDCSSESYTFKYEYDGKNTILFEPENTPIKIVIMTLNDSRMMFEFESDDVPPGGITYVLTRE